jgi:hypothetical protein
MRLELPQELNTPEIDLPPVNHIAKFAPGPLLQAAMDLASTTTDVSFHLSHVLQPVTINQLVSLGLASVQLAPSPYARDLPQRRHFKIGRTK